MNPIMAIILNVAFPWDFFFSALIHRYRDEIAQQLPLWLNAWEKLEASMSLADFAYLNPDYIFPDFISDRENKDQPILAAKDLGHCWQSDLEFRRVGKYFHCQSADAYCRAKCLEPGFDGCLAGR